MDIDALVERVRASEISVTQAVHETPIHHLDEVLPAIRRHGRPWEVCTALFDRISKAPLSEFQRLAAVFDKNCAGFVPDDKQV